MMYGQPAFLPYQGPYGSGFYPPVQQQEAAQIRAQQQTTQSFAWVDSEQDAKNWVVLPGQSMILMSRNDSVFWVKATDQSGMPQSMRLFRYEEALDARHGGVPAQEGYVSRLEFDAVIERVKALEDRKCGYHDDAKEAEDNR